VSSLFSPTCVECETNCAFAAHRAREAALATYQQRKNKQYGGSSSDGGSSSSSSIRDNSGIAVTWNLIARAATGAGVRGPGRTRLEPRLAAS
jgi:hypothetical protein